MVIFFNYFFEIYTQNSKYTHETGCQIIPTTKPMIDFNDQVRIIHYIFEAGGVANALQPRRKNNDMLGITLNTFNCTQGKMTAAFFSRRAAIGQFCGPRNYDFLHCLISINSESMKY